MKQRILRLLKIISVSFILGIVFSYGISTYLKGKMDSEVPKFMITSYEIQELTQTYHLCSGLINSNPTKENLDTCKYIQQKLEVKVSKLKEETPYISFYHKYIQRVEY